MSKIGDNAHCSLFTSTSQFLELSGYQGDMRDDVAETVLWLGLLEVADRSFSMKRDVHSLTFWGPSQGSTRMVAQLPGASKPLSGN